LQLYYNRLDRRPEDLFFSHARRDNLGIIGRVPLASGLLTGKYKPGVVFAADDVRATIDPGKLGRDLAEVERLQKTEVPAGVTMAKWALAWCLRDPLVSCVIGGCKNPEQARENAAAAGLISS
jgi:aryl-alcohol dehydrogenase-like predicted oxidoreductase